MYVNRRSAMPKNAIETKVGVRDATQAPLRTDPDVHIPILSIQLHVCTFRFPYCRCKTKEKKYREGADRHFLKNLHL